MRDGVGAIRGGPSRPRYVLSAAGRLDGRQATDAPLRAARPVRRALDEACRAQPLARLREASRSLRVGTPRGRRRSILGGPRQASIHWTTPYRSLRDRHLPGGMPWRG